MAAGTGMSTMGVLYALDRKDGRACRPIIAAGTHLGRVHRAAARAWRVPPRPSVGLPPSPHPRPDGVRARRPSAGPWVGLRAHRQQRLLGRHHPPPAQAVGAAGIAERVHAVALAAYHRIIGLLLADIGADGCTTKAPCGGDKTGPSPVDRRKGGLKRSVATGGGVPLGIVSAGANRHDSPLLGPTLHAAATQVSADWPAQVTVHLDAGYDPPSPASCSTGWACTARSPARASPPRSRSANDGWSSALMVG
jgi:hypothetical protein